MLIWGLGGAPARAGVVANSGDLDAGGAGLAQQQHFAPQLRRRLQIERFHNPGRRNRTSSGEMRIFC